MTRGTARMGLCTTPRDAEYRASAGTCLSAHKRSGSQEAQHEHSSKEVRRRGREIIPGTTRATLLALLTDLARQRRGDLSLHPDLSDRGVSHPVGKHGADAAR